MRYQNDLLIDLWCGHGLCIGIVEGCKMKYKKKKKPVPPVTIIGDAVTREIMKIKAIKVQ